MVKNALGLIEVIGLAAGVEAADAAVKAANVTLLGYELTKGGGMVVVKLVGDVGAVKAAVDSAAAAAAKGSKVYATHVIPRPHSELGGMIETKDTVGMSAPAKPTETPSVSQPISIQQEAVEPLVQAEEAAETPAQDADSGQSLLPVSTDEPKRGAYTCNLCGDPHCPRKKGDPKVTCIHYDKNNKEDE
jgi:ethanolamine utilization protein EutM